MSAPVVVEVRHDDAEALAEGLADPRGFRDVGERAVAVVAVEQV
jgi:hypothetical protein